MKKLIVILGFVGTTILVSCSASVHTPVAGAGASVGSIQKVHPTENVRN